MAMCWSFGNNGMDYLYSKELEAIKKAAHMAVVFGDYTLADEMGMNLHYLEGVDGLDARYAKYKKMWNGSIRGGNLGLWRTLQENVQSPGFAVFRSATFGYLRLLHLEGMRRCILKVGGYLQPKEITKK